MNTASQNDSELINKLYQQGIDYLYGPKVKRYETGKKGLEIIKECVSKGLTEAKMHLASMYISGGRDENSATILEVNEDAAAALWTECANNGDGTAQMALGRKAYEQGSYETAASWYEKAATQGFHTAQDRLASMYKEGVGVTQDDNIAKHWLKKANARTL